MTMTGVRIWINRTVFIIIPHFEMCTNNRLKMHEYYVSNRYPLKASTCSLSFPFFTHFLFSFLFHFHFLFTFFLPFHFLFPSSPSAPLPGHTSPGSASREQVSRQNGRESRGLILNVYKNYEAEHFWDREKKKTIPCVFWLFWLCRKHLEQFLISSINSLKQKQSRS